MKICAPGRRKPAVRPTQYIIFHQQQTHHHHHHHHHQQQQPCCGARQVIPACYARVLARWRPPRSGSTRSSGASRCVACPLPVASPRREGSLVLPPFPRARARPHTSLERLSFLRDTSPRSGHPCPPHTPTPTPTHTHTRMHARPRPLHRLLLSLWARFDFLSPSPPITPHNWTQKKK